MIARQSKSLAAPALERGLSLLEFLTAQSKPLTLTQVAQGLGLTVSEIQRPVACLLERGYLRRTAAGAYVLSGMLYRLANLHPPHLHLQRSALPLMLDFARHTSQSVHLCVPDGEAALLLSDVPGGGLVRITLQAGARLDSNTTVSGRILQAFGCLSHDNQADYKKRILQSKASNLIRKRNYEKANSSYAIGIMDMGVPVRNHDGRVIAALTASLLLLKKTKVVAGSLLKDLHQCALGITQAL